MLSSVHPQEIQHYHYQYQPQHRPAFSPSAPPPAPFAYLYGGSSMPHRVSASPVLARASPPPSKSPQEAAVAQALEIARESPDGASDPTVSKILEHALAHAWGKVKAQPESYVMTRDEFAVFNFFQHRFVGDSTAVAARRRFWDNAQA